MAPISFVVFTALIGLGCAQLIIPDIFPPTEPQQLFSPNCTIYAQYAQFLGIWHPSCAINGTYAPLQLHPSNTTLCLSKDGRLLFNGSTSTIKSCTCHRQRYDTQQAGLIGAFVPQCDYDGTYSPMQFHGSTGYIKCFSAEGVEIVSGPHIVDCQCHRRRYEAQSHGLIGAFIPTCEADGTYSAMQHHGSTGLTKCFTATGVELMAGRHIRDCHCPRARYEAQRPGLVGAFVPQCEDDGTYSAMQFHASTGYVKCFSSNGTEILTGRNIVDCRCPRARYDAQMPGLIGAFIPQCEDNGTYSAMQIHGSTGYVKCFSSNGTELLTGRNIVDCRCHRQRYESQSLGLVGSFTPQCDDDGTYAAMQFHASTGYVKCFAKNGTELLSGRNIRGCKCPRARHEAQRPDGFVGNYVPQCEDDGVYTKRQSHGSTGYSWCVDEEGVQISIAVPPHQFSTLTC
jgi:hypothetical protein